MHTNNTSTSTHLQDGAEQIAALRDHASESQIAEHIRGVVAATMGSASTHASEASSNAAERWQQWALAIADGLTPVAA